MSDLKNILLAMNQRPMVIYPAYRQLVGGHWAAAAFLAQLLYWWQVSGGERFYKTDAEIAAELGMTEKELRTAKAKLKQLPFLTITREGMPAKTYYTFDYEKLAEALSEVGAVCPNGQTSSDRSVQTSSAPMGGSSFAHSERTDLTEKTAEKTTESINSPPYPPYSSTGPSGRLGEEEAAKDAGVQSTGPSALEASLGPTARAIVAVAPGALHRRVPGRDYTVLDRLRAWDEMWTPDEVRAAWSQAKRDAHTHPLKVFWLILEGEIPLDASLVERPPEPQRPKKPDREYRYIGIDDVPDPLEVLYGRKSASA